MTWAARAPRAAAGCGKPPPTPRGTPRTRMARRRGPGTCTPPPQLCNPRLPPRRAVGLQTKDTCRASSRHHMTSPPCHQDKIGELCTAGVGAGERPRPAEASRCCVSLKDPMGTCGKAAQWQWRYGGTATAGVITARCPALPARAVLCKHNRRGGVGRGAERTARVPTPSTCPPARRSGGRHS